jgi:hypothetical protein
MTNWWPTSLTHITHENPWGDNHVVVAELRSFEGTPFHGYRRTISVLIPISKLPEVKANLVRLENEVSASGPHPTPSDGQPYEPKFWVGAQGLLDLRYEPLVLSWSSHDRTVLFPDPGFLMTYGLTPRPGESSMILWDDPAAPSHEVVKVSAPSTWLFPSYTPSHVSISRDYLQDYLTLRQMALVQVFWEQRCQPADEEIEGKLGAKDAVELTLPDRRIHLNRITSDPRTVSVQGSGARIIASPRALPISSNSLNVEGLAWPGFDGSVTYARAMRMGFIDYVYVDDHVLDYYEGKPEYSVNPNSGSVQFGTQWSVSSCERVARNLIRIEIKKLYEGVPSRVTRHWHKFAVDPPPVAALPAALRERNIAIRAKEITYGVTRLGEALAAFAGSVGVQEDFVKLQRGMLDHHGWWSSTDTSAIAKHAPLDLAKDAFLERCLSLNKVVVEGLSERALRMTLHAICVPSTEIADFGSLKLLNCVVGMCLVANKTELQLSTAGGTVWNRLCNSDVDAKQPIPHLFALYDMRLLKAHISEDRKIVTALQRFNVGSGETVAGYGRILDKIYDALSAELTRAAEAICRA